MMSEELKAFEAAEQLVAYCKNVLRAQLEDDIANRTFENPTELKQFVEAWVQGMVEPQRLDKNIYEFEFVPEPLLGLGWLVRHDRIEDIREAILGGEEDDIGHLIQHDDIMVDFVAWQKAEAAA